MARYAGTGNARSRGTSSERDGHITEKPQGTDGFGYDPIFMPDGYDRTFAQMTAEEKNNISHRGLAVEKLANFFATDKKNKR